MAYFNGSIYAKTLDMETHLTVVLPYDKPAKGQQHPCKVLYLLHGISNNSDSWMRMSAVEQYARRCGLALVIPEVQRSFYTDMQYGLPYFSYVADELPALVRSWFDVSDRREDTYVAGLSMGGYGALKVGLSRPETFGACASFSGAVHLAALQKAMEEKGPAQQAESQAIFGMQLEVRPQDDLFHLAAQAGRLPAEKRPRMMATCGTEDFLIDMNRAFRDYMKTLPISFRYEEWPGDHEWDFWDASVKKAIAFFLEETC